MKSAVFFIACNLSLICFAQVNKTGTFIDDRDSQAYQWVKIGTQIWMSVNLRYTSPTGSWNYQDNASNELDYGRLYIWDAAKNACPTGWHLPSKIEFETLLKAVGGDGEKAYIALLKSGESDFDAVLAGWRTENGGYYFIDFWGGYWSKTPTDSEWPYLLSFYSKNSKAYISHDYNKSCGMSVRCIKDSK